MTSVRRTDDLTREECIGLLGAVRHALVASVVIGESVPARLLCFPLPDGDILIPTGFHPDLASAAADRQVTIRFENFDPDTHRGWVVRCAGVARPIGRRERPPAGVHTSALAMRYAFENGVHVSLGELTGRQVSTDPTGTGPGAARGT